MAKTLPVQGGDQGTWGTKLNDFITQLQDGSNGSINSKSTNPTNLTSADEGYTFVHVPERALKRYKGTGTGTSNSDWDVLLDADFKISANDLHEQFIVTNSGGNLSPTGTFQTYNGTTWVDTQTNVAVGTTLPTTATNGQYFFDVASTSTLSGSGKLLLWDEGEWTVRRVSVAYAATSPYFNPPQVGTTYVNTTSKTLRRWNGTAMVTLLDGSTSKEKLTADRIYYVNNTTGDNLNSGLYTSESLFSISRALEIIRDNIQFNGFNVTIKLAQSSTPYVGAVVDIQNTVTIEGSFIYEFGNNPSSNLDLTAVTTGNTSGTRYVFKVERGSTLILKYLRIFNPASTSKKRTIWVSGGSCYLKNHLAFSLQSTAISQQHDEIFGEGGAYIECTDVALDIRGNGGQFSSFIYLENSNLKCVGSTQFNIDDPCTIAQAFVKITNISVLSTNDATMTTSGSGGGSNSTGVRYSVSRNSVLTISGTFWPGSLPGVTLTGGVAE
jgi:hypothetical protein